MNRTEAIKILTRLMWVIVFAGYCTQCAEENPLADTDGALVIDSIAPSSGLAGTQIRLYGKGFSLSPDENVVTLNEKVITVKEPASLGTLLAEIPMDATTGPLHIQVGRLEAEGPVFTIISPPTILDVDPLRGYAGNRVVITGSYLHNVTAVRFNGVDATVTASSEGMLEVTAPASTTGPITLIHPHGVVTGPIFSYLPIPVIDYVQTGRALTNLYVVGRHFATNPQRVQVFFNNIAVPVEAGGIIEDGFVYVFIPSHPLSSQENPTIVRIVSDGISSLPYRYIVQPYINDLRLEHGTAGKINVRLLGGFFGFAGGGKAVRITRADDAGTSVAVRVISWAPQEILVEIDEVSGFAYDAMVEVEGVKSAGFIFKF